ncbi:MULTISPECIES: toll/interleukin-1 receptor domain-containing protein [unclassified Yoonia]|uniref:toll/interleukin-1 receptor domain-containing protein n=1 Tax=unclassified Yoonia TaxID=2629118 RepID=UPI002AFFCA32|nr:MULTISPECIES: toll/interleukin-1 receptor domain-containing protein [unclassified Yoonia]
MARVFISHSSADKAFARMLAKDLEDRGILVWIDEKNIRVGDSIRTSIEDGLAKCDFAVIVITKDSLSRPWVTAELSALFSLEASAKRKMILPCVVQDASIPLLLLDKKYADFRTDYAVGLRDVLDAVSPNSSSWDFLSEHL